MHGYFISTSLAGGQQGCCCSIADLISALSDRYVSVCRLFLRQLLAAADLEWTGSIIGGARARARTHARQHKLTHSHTRTRARAHTRTHSFSSHVLSSHSLKPGVGLVVLSLQFFLDKYICFQKLIIIFYSSLAA